MSSMKDSFRIVLPNYLNSDRFFVFLLCIIFVFGGGTFIKSEHQKSDLENRTLARFEHFTIDGFASGSFQENFENAFSDQFVKSADIRAVYGELINALPTFGLDSFACSGRYVTVPGSTDGSRVSFNCEDYIMYRPSTMDSSQEKIFNQNISKYNRVNSIVDTYYYFINDATTFDFSSGAQVIDYAASLKEKLKGKYHFASFSFDGFNEFKKYFYNTDHHWNYIGSYKGYVEISGLLGIEDVAKPAGTLTGDKPIYGSHARTLRYYKYSDNMVAYSFDVPEHDTLINRKAEEYGHFADYFERNYTYDKNTNYYSYVYGPDRDEIIFDFHNSNKENLLIISNSFSNPINVLLAQHFDTTYVVDLRYYNKQIGEEFSIEDYVKNNKIQKVLFIMSPTFVTKKDSNQGLEV